MSSSAHSQLPTTTAQQRGLWLGLLGVALFALTLPMTRLATGSVDAPQLSGVFVASGRAVVAALLSAAWLAWARAPWPTRRDWPALAGVAGGVVLGFPLCTSVALRQVEAVHASVMLGLLPLATAAVGAWLQRQRPPLAFWACAGLGSALVLGFALWQPGAASLALQPADALLLAAMACAAFGYGLGAQLAPRLGAEAVIGWALLLALPLNLPLALATWPSGAIKNEAWMGFGYVAVGSMWLGFFAWYRALALGGTVRVSQLQLVQPFLSMLFAVPLLGEALSPTSLGFGLAVAAVVLLGRRLPVQRPRPTRPT